MKEKNPKGKKVYLRPPKSEDFAEFTARAKESRKLHKGLVNPPIDQKSFNEFLERNENSTNKLFLICRIKDDGIAGAANLSQIFYGGFQNAYLGYYLFENFTGSGLMNEALRLILDYAFNDLKLHRIEANVQPHNVASKRVLEKIGFTKEGFSRKYLKIGGRWCDHERWALIVEDWKKHGKRGS